MKRILAGLSTVLLLSASLPAGAAYYGSTGGATPTFGPLTGDCTTTAAGATATTCGMNILNVTSGATAALASTTRFVCVNKTTGSATTITGSLAVGIPFTIKDCKGDAATNNITFTPGSGITIDGAASYTLSGAYYATNFIFTSATTVAAF